MLVYEYVPVRVWRIVCGARVVTVSARNVAFADIWKRPELDAARQLAMASLQSGREPCISGICTYIQFSGPRMPCKKGLAVINQYTRVGMSMTISAHISGKQHGEIEAAGTPT